MAPHGPASTFPTAFGTGVGGTLRRSRNSDNRAASLKKIVPLLVCMISVSTLSKLFCRLSFSSGVSDWRGGGGGAITVAVNLIEDRKMGASGRPEVDGGEVVQIPESFLYKPQCESDNV
jgi:hypothetical protein